MIILDIEQRTEAWYAARCGIPTASNFDKIITTRGVPSTQYVKYMYQLAGEHIAQKPEETFQSQAMQTGVEREDEARQLYQIINDVIVDQVGFCITEDEPRCGCSPDGLVGQDGMIEIKCPKLVTHVEYLVKGILPPEYIPQVQGQLLVTGRAWCDFMSYYPGLRPLIVRVTRDEKYISALNVLLKNINDELKLTISKIQ